jgi:hypothetical protein
MILSTGGEELINGEGNDEFDSILALGSASPSGTLIKTD